MTSSIGWYPSLFNFTFTGKYAGGCNHPSVTSLMNYLFLFLAVLLIGIFSPTGIIRAVLTAVALYIYTYMLLYNI